MFFLEKRDCDFADAGLLLGILPVLLGAFYISIQMFVKIAVDGM